MNIGIDSLVEEIISIELEAEGISPEVIDKVLEAIKYSCKETNFLHNSVADSNFIGAQIKEEKRKEEAREKEHQAEVKKMQQEHEDLKAWNRRRIYALNEEIERLKKLIP